MFKKSILMLAVFLVVGFASVQAQNQARMEQLMREAEQIEARVDARGGTPTTQELQRLMEIQQELMLGGYFNTMDVPTPQVQQQPQPRQQQQPQQQRDTFPAGQTQGWPSASQFSQVSLPTLRQPAGLTATYTFYRESQTIEIYIRGGTQATIDDLARQVQSGTNSNLYRENNPGRYYQVLSSEERGHVGTSRRVIIELIGGGVSIIANQVSG
uniref:Uncharacterized protein n=1 Tax=uncultured bacterium contig00031 TaxID=1181520 RepID=A0A806K0V1_9BACT|nr:hypothetical protein [uncultured bacterium contig00031]